MHTLRLATSADCGIIARYNAAMAHETEGLELDLALLQAGVRAMFDHPERGFYLVAEDAQAQVIGCLMVTYEWSDWRNAMFWWIQSVYVHPDQRRRGVFRSLYQEVQRRGDEAGGVCGYRLYVEQENHAAQATYRSLGMDVTCYRVCEDQSRGL